MKIGQRLGRALERAGKSQLEIGGPNDLFDRAEEGARRLPGDDPAQRPFLHLCAEVLDRVIENDAKQKRISRGLAPPAETRGFSVVRDARRREYDEVEELPAEEIPEEYQRVHANRVDRVLTDAMEILEGSLIFARDAQNHEAADGATVICRLNGKLYLRRLDRRGGRTTLEASNPRYSAIRVDLKNDRFSLVAVVCTLDALRA